MPPMKHMQQTVKVRRSKGLSVDELAKHANAKNMCLVDVAKAVDLSGPYFSMVRRGVRSIAESKCKKIEKLIGYKATRANWPTMRVGE